MRVKNAVLTFVAMGGFAMPILFQSTSSSAKSVEGDSVQDLAAASPAVSPAAGTSGTPKASA